MSQTCSVGTKMSVRMTLASALLRDRLESQTDALMILKSFCRSESEMSVRRAIMSASDVTDLETMPDEDAAEIEKESQLFVSDLERDEGVLRDVRVEVAVWQRAMVSSARRSLAEKIDPRLTVDAREVGQVVDDWFARMDVVVDERYLLRRAGPSKDGHASERESGWPDHLLGSVGSIFELILHKQWAGGPEKSSPRGGRRLTSCIDTNSASMATRVPSDGSSSAVRLRCLMRSGLRCLGDGDDELWAGETRGVCGSSSPGDGHVSTEDGGINAHR